MEATASHFFLRNENPFQLLQNEGSGAPRTPRKDRAVVSASMRA